jgi:hypothetical protein
MDKKILAAALITPLMLLSNPVSSETVTSSYSHTSQSSIVGAGVNGYGVPHSTYTSAGTQTFNGYGQPSDSDSDSD